MLQTVTLAQVIRPGSTTPVHTSVHAGDAAQASAQEALTTALRTAWDEEMAYGLGPSGRIPEARLRELFAERGWAVTADDFAVSR